MSRLRNARSRFLNAAFTGLARPVTRGTSSGVVRELDDRPTSGRDRTRRSHSRSVCSRRQTLIRSRFGRRVCGLLGALDMQIRFDRGTILIDPRRGADPKRLPGVAWDPRVRSWRAPADAYAAVIAQLSEDAIAFQTGLPEHATKTTGWSTPELRWYQQEALAAWGAAGGRGVIAL